MLAIADFFLERTTLRPKIGIICGSGLGSLADQLTERDSFPYESIPNFPISTVEGHAGQMIFGLLGGIPVMCMQGRFHYYEGYPLAKVWTHFVAEQAICILNRFPHFRTVLDADSRHETGGLHASDRNECGRWH